VKYAFYLGCIVPNRYPNIEKATRVTLPRLDIELEDMEGASCCPAPGVIKSFDRLTWLLLSARNLCIAEEMGLDILTLCNGCYATLKEANTVLAGNEKERRKINEMLSAIGRKFKGSIKVKHVAEVLYRDVGLDAIRSSVKRGLPIKVAAHYGCHILKPTDLREWNTVEHPTFLDEMIEATGASSVPYRNRMMCCGAGGGLRSGVLDVALDMLREKLENMRQVGAECIVDICPFCHLQFDAGQVQLEQKFKAVYNIPVVYYTQLLGLAMGLSESDVGLRMNRVAAASLLELEKR